jgi:hypothetical protein
MFENGKPLSDDEIVINPAVPASAQHALACIGAAGQEKASNIRSRLIPYQQSPPQTPPPPKLVSRRHALAWGALALSFLVEALLAALAGSVGWVVILLIVAGATTLHSVMNVFATTRKSRTWAQEQWDMRYADAFYHRQYIVPRTDLDDKARRIPLCQTEVRHPE